MGGNHGRRRRRVRPPKTPVTNAEKWAWLLDRGTLDFPNRVIGTQTTSKGAIITAYAPQTRTDVQELAGQAFDEATTVEDKARVLKAYASRFAHCAWDQDSWLWPLWWEWRARTDRDALTLLRALAAGVRSPASGWMDASQGRAWKTRQAQAALERWRADEALQTLYADWVEGQRKSYSEEAAEYDRLYLRDVVVRIKMLTGYRTTKRELQKRKLSGVLSIAAHKAFGVRERDLH